MNSGLAAIHPIPAFLYYLGVIVLCMSVYHPVFLATALVLVVLVNIAQDRGQRLRKSIVFIAIMGLAIMVLNPFISHRGETMLFYFMDNPITLEAIVYGITMSLSLLTILVAFISYNNIITPDKFMYLFSSIFPKVSLLTMMAVRFVPLLTRRAAEISLIQATRGINLKEGSLIKRAKNGVQILNILITWSLEEAIETAQSMRARGYGLSKKRTSYVIYKMDQRDWLVLLVLLLTAIIPIAGWHFGQWRFDIYPKVSEFNFGLATWINFAIYCFYMGLPVLLEGMERVRWR